MLDEGAFGYDTEFTTRARRGGRLEYYVDLPAEAFPAEEASATAANNTGAGAIAGPSNVPSATPNRPTRRLRVMERLCHRKCIRGRATIVLRVREVIRPGYLDQPEDPQSRAKTRSQAKREGRPVEEAELLGTRDYVLKLMWRDPNKKMEGEVLERLVGIYGVGQHLWHSDAFKTCGLSTCGGTMGDCCGNCLDRTPSRDQVLVTKNLTNLDIEIPEEQEGEETQYTPIAEAVQTDEYSPVHVHRTSRIYCRLLMSTVGSPLCSAENPRQLLQAVLDAILGYWRLVNKGLLHRDISDGNVLMLQEGRGYYKREWKAERMATSNLDPELAQSELLLQEVLDRLDRDPTGMLNDFDLFTTHGEIGDAFFGDLSWEDDEREVGEPESKRRKLSSGAVASTPSSTDKGKRKEQGAPGGSSLSRAIKVDQGACQAIDFRTGTPVFMSARTLHVAVGERYAHHFMDDLESFFWLILWCVVEHVDSEDSRPTERALGLLDNLNQSNLSNIAITKSDILSKCQRRGIWMREILELCSNSWAADPAIVKVVLTLGDYFYGFFIDRSFLECNPSEVFPMVVEVIMNAIHL
ncbi:hypothetical protein FRC10_008187 [Ceratobasidium sp. 414]|nr:hypothetical protein FRC10_008187 [Ceratobasidium sp. 414]